MKTPSKKLPALMFSSMVLLMPACADLSLASMDNTKQLQDLRDIDRDGVIEAREQCADTLAGSTIDNVGCSKQVDDMLWTIYTVDQSL